MRNLELALGPLILLGRLAWLIGREVLILVMVFLLFVMTIFLVLVDVCRTGAMTTSSRLDSLIYETEEAFDTFVVFLRGKNTDEED